MRYILKTQEPESFNKWKRDNPDSRWSDFSQSEAYSELREKIIEQQKQMCCYCEISLNKESSAHVEHLKGQHNYPKEIFNFANLLASCQYTDCCGHKKGRAYFDEMVSPLEHNCQIRFTYTGNGKVIAVDETDDNALRTIELLGLNCKRLKDRRVSIIKTLKDADDDYLKQALDNCLEWYGGFFSVIQCVEN